MVTVAAIVVGLGMAAAGCGRYSIGALKAQKAYKDGNDLYKASQWKEAAEKYEYVLQQGFRDHIGMSPTAYLRRVRLARAHDQLHRGEGTVAEVAYRWGFTHLGRFATAYASIYGVTPSTTRSTRT